MRLFMLFLCAAFLQSCSSVTSDIEDAKKEVSRFHILFDSDQFQEIYQKSSDEIKNNTSEKDFIDFLKSTKARFGNFKRSTLQDTNISTSIFNKTRVILVFKTEYSLLTAMETFYFDKINNSFLLSGYNFKYNVPINSLPSQNTAPSS